MKKKSNYLIIIMSIICICMLSGCVRYSTTIEVKKNGKADVSMLVATLQDENNTYSIDSDENKEKWEGEGWNYEDYSEDDYSGYVITKTDVDLEELGKEINNDDTGTEVDTNKLNVTKDGSQYTISWDLSGDNESLDPATVASYLSNSGGYARFVLKLPIKPVSSNAKEISEDGKTLTWDLLDLGEEEKIEVTFNLSGSMPIGLIAAIAAVIVIGLVAYYMSKKKKESRPGILEENKEEEIIEEKTKKDETIEEEIEENETIEEETNENE